MIAVKIVNDELIGVGIKYNDTIAVSVLSNVCQYIPKDCGRIAYDGATLTVY